MMLKRLKKMLLITCAGAIASLLVFSGGACFAAANIVIEAESGTIHQKFTSAMSSEASGGGYIQAKNEVASTSGADVEYRFEVPEYGSYKIYLRLKSPMAYNSVHVLIDGVQGTTYKWDFGNDWCWVPSFYPTYLLEKGEHTLTFRLRQPNIMIDKILLTSDLSYSPIEDDTGDATEAQEYKDGKGYYAYTLPAIVPPDEHPRLMVRASDLPKIRENLNHPQNQSTYEYVKKLAENQTDGILAAGSNYNETVLSYIEAKAFQYLITEEKRYGREAKDAILNYVRTLDVGLQPSMLAARNGGHAVFVASCVYDWCYDQFSEEEKQDFMKSCEKIMSKFEFGFPAYFEKGEMQLSSHTTEAAYLKDVAAYSIAVYDEDPFIYNHNTGLLLEQFMPIRNFRSAGGFNFDGSTYGQYRDFCDLYCMYMYEKIGYTGMFDPANAWMAYQFIYTRRPDGNYIMEGDYAGYSLVLQNRNIYSALYMLSSALAKDGYMKTTYMKNIEAKDVYGSSMQNDLSNPLYLIMNDTSIPYKDLEELPKTKYFGSPAGVMVARTGWDEGPSSNTAIAYMKLPEYFWGSHEHYDAGSFQFYYRGMLALDSGLYEHDPYVNENGVLINSTGYDSIHDQNYHSSTIAHNCMLVYDPKEPTGVGNSYAGQRLTGTPRSTRYHATTMDDFLSEKFQRGKIIGYDYGPDMHTPEYTYFEGDLSLAYTDKVSDYSRAFMFLNLYDEDIPAALIVYDRMKTKNSSYQKTWLLHSVEEPQIDGKNTTIRMTQDHNDGKMVNTTLLPENANIEKIGGSGKEFWVNGANYYAKGAEKGNEGGNWRIEIQPNDSSAQDYFLNVMQVGKNDDSIPSLPVTYQEIGEYLAVSIKDRVVYLRKNEGVNYADVSLQATGDGEVSFIVANLAEGIWTVVDGQGNELSSIPVNGENGVAYFRGAAGAYTLKWRYEDNIPGKDFNVLNSTKPVEGNRVYVHYDNAYAGRAYQEENGTVMMDLADLQALMGVGALTMEGDKITFTDEARSITYQLGSNQAVMHNGEVMSLTSGPVLKDGRPYVPFLSMAEFMRLENSFNDLVKIQYIAAYKYYVEGANPLIYQYPDSNIAKIKDLEYSESINDQLNGYASVDGNINTNWSALNPGATVIYELNDTYKITKFQLAHYLGSRRRQKFSLYVSMDKVNWTKVYTGEGSGKSADFEDVFISAPVEARYVKFEGHGNSDNNISNLCEIKIYCEE